MRWQAAQGLRVARCDLQWVGVLPHRLTRHCEYERRLQLGIIGLGIIGLGFIERFLDVKFIWILEHQ